jgi:hypothetical protein
MLAQKRPHRLACCITEGRGRVVIKINHYLWRDRAPSRPKPSRVASKSLSVRQRSKVRDDTDELPTLIPKSPFCEVVPPFVIASMKMTIRSQRDASCHFTW